MLKSLALGGTAFVFGWGRHRRRSQERSTTEYRISCPGVGIEPCQSYLRQLFEKSPAALYDDSTPTD